MMTDKNVESQARLRLSYLFDEGTYTEINSLAKEKDSLTSVVTAYGYVNGNPTYAFSQDKTVNSGAVGIAHSGKITKLYSLAAKTGTPIVGIHDSNGAFVDGTVQSLAAYGEMLYNSSIISGVVPQISIIAGTCAGSASMLACSSDFVIMTKDSEFFMSPPFDAEVNGVGTANASAKAGIASMVCEDDKTAILRAKELLNLLPINNLVGAPLFEYEESNVAISSDLTSIVNAITDAGSAIEISAEYGKSAYTSLATIAGSTVGIAATNKVPDKLTADDCSKLSRFVRTCDAFAIPVITIVDTEGFDASSESELAGSIKDMARLANCYAEATTVKISVITGKAIGPAFIALAGKNIGSDFTYAWEDAVISPLSSLTAVEFLWHDKLKGVSDANAKRNELAEEYEKTLASANSAAELNCIDEIITPGDTRATIISALDILSGKRVTKLPKKHNNIPL